MYLITQWGELTLPPELTQINSESAWRHMVLNAGGVHWHIYVSKKTSNGRKTVNYLGRYLKKPPISGSRLAIAQVGGKKELTGRTDIEIEISTSAYD